MFELSMKEKNIKLIWGIGAFAFIAFFVVRTILKDNVLKSKHFYSVGVVIDKYKGLKQPMPTVKFEYKINNIKLQNSHAYSSDKYKVEVGQKYLMIVSPDDLNNSRLLLKVPLADSIQAPYSGWEEPPFGLKGSDDIKW